MVLCNGVGDGLQQHRFTGAWRRDDQTALTFSEWRYEIDNARREIIRRDLHAQLLFRIERRQVIEEDFFSRLVGRLEVDRLNLDQGEITFAFFRRTNLTADGVASAQIEFTNLRGRDVDVVGPGQIVVFRRAEK